MADRYSYSPAPTRKVKALQFGILDADFLVSRMSSIMGGVSRLLPPGQLERAAVLSICSVHIQARGAVSNVAGDELIAPGARLP